LLLLVPVRVGGARRVGARRVETDARPTSDALRKPESTSVFCTSSFTTTCGSSRNDGTTFLPLSYDLVSLTVTSSPFTISPIIFWTWSPSARVSFQTVMDCLSWRIACTFALSASWPVMTGQSAPGA
jgi:hypothetical protein